MARLLAAAALSFLLAGCPASDDLTEVADAGNKRLDILLAFDAPVAPDEGTAPEQDDGLPPHPDVVQGCVTHEECAGVFGSLSQCEVERCSPESFQCVVEAVSDGAACDDGNACTVTSCKGGACSTTQETPCDDGNPCTTDACYPDSGCNHIINSIECEDGDPCSAGDKCHEGVCVPGSKNVCKPTGTKDDPGKSCHQLVQDYPAYASDSYYVEPVDGGDPFEVYCDMVTAGGGWARVAAVAADVPICSLGEAVGNAASLLSEKPAGTVILPLGTAKQLRFEAKEVLVTHSTDYYVFRSESPAWKWSAIATGAVNAANVADYGVLGAANGGTFVALVGAATSPTAKGPMLLGGTQKSGGQSPILGIGASPTGKYSQEGCITSHTGFYSGTVFQPKGWGTAGVLYIR